MSSFLVVTVDVAEIGIAFVVLVFVDIVVILTVFAENFVVEGVVFVVVLVGRCYHCYYSEDCCCCHSWFFCHFVDISVVFVAVLIVVAVFVVVFIHVAIIVVFLAIIICACLSFS